MKKMIFMMAMTVTIMMEMITNWYDNNNDVGQ